LKNASVESIVARVLYELVRIPSPPGREKECALKFREYAVRFGLNSWIDSTNSVYATLPNAKRRASILLAGHIDTIEGFLEPRISGLAVHGRGAVDAKGPLVSMLLALYALKEERVECPVALAALSGEEGESAGARNLVSKGSVPPYIIIGEPTNLTNVVIGYRGSVKVHITCAGKGGHPSSPWIGDSALDRLLELVDALRRAFPGTSSKEVTFSITRLVAGESTRSLPARAECYVDFRVPLGMSARELVSRLLQEIGGLDRNCSMTFLSFEEPFYVKPQSLVPRSLVRGIIGLGMKPSLAIKAGTSDMNVLGPYAKSIAAYGPGDSRLAHSTCEEISVNEVLKAARVYLEAVRFLCKKAEEDIAVELPV